MAKENYNDFDNIFRKYRPLGIPIGYFRYNVRLYSNMDTLMTNSPYGGENICWYGNDYANPDLNITPTQQNPSGGTGQNNANPNDAAVFSKYKTRWCAGAFSEAGVTERQKLLKGEKSASGYIFVLTVAVKFPFSSAFVAKLFNGGSNTTKPGVYILWARGSGIIN